MYITSKYILKRLVFSALFLCVKSCSTNSNAAFSETVKVSLRDVGHHLLLINKDSTSVVKPVLALNENKYQLAFESKLLIHPDSLVNQIKSSFQKANLPKHYLVEVLRCEDNEVAYSYEMKQNVEKDIIPCGGRQLKNGCYLITLRFTKLLATEQNSFKFLYLLCIGVLLLLAFVIYKKKTKTHAKENDSNFASLGCYKFYPEQNKLIKEATEISLSKKECELLEIFVANPNQVIKRDELMKKVWEDNGVFVGRSLDTYVSKLRKKLKDDNSITLTNVHGVGYKLEIS
jgi:hypothetical protein